MRYVLLLAPIMLAGCMTTPTDTEVVAEAGATAGFACSNDALESYVGKIATAGLGAEMLKRSGARVLRWVPPDTAVTMDFREDRLTVAYDRAMKITSARCG